MPKTIPKIVDKWFHRIYCDDLYIGVVRLKETTKQYRIVGFDPGEGKNTVIGFNGEPQSTRTLFGFDTTLKKNDHRLSDSFEEAREKLQAAVDRVVEDAERKLEKAKSLQLLFNEVHYEKVTK